MISGGESSGGVATYRRRCGQIRRGRRCRLLLQVIRRGQRAHPRLKLAPARTGSARRAGSTTGRGSACRLERTRRELHRPHFLPPRPRIDVHDARGVYPLFCLGAGGGDGSQPLPACLRVHRNHPTRIHLRPGTTPDQIKSPSQAQKTRVSVCTHPLHIFAMRLGWRRPCRGIHRAVRRRCWRHC